MLRFSLAAQQVLTNPAEFRTRAAGPFLLWESGPQPTQLPEWATDPGLRPQRPSLSDPLLLEVRKRGHKGNGFGLGITVGRTQNNDLPLDVPTVSRFHAYFKRGEAGGWQLVDVESHNGTYLSGHRLTPGKPAPLFEMAELRFGDVAVTFLSPAAFERYVQAKQRDLSALRALKAPRV